MLLEDFEFVHIQEKRGAPYAVAIPNGKTASHCKEAEAARPGAVSEPPYSPLSAAPEPTAPSKQVQPTLPPPSASVNEVREYIKITLIVKYNTSQEYADEIAMKWTLGRGWTLREYSESDFRRCFGPEIGLSLHRAVKEARKVDTRPTETQELEKWTKRGGPQEYRSKYAPRHRGSYFTFSFTKYSCLMQMLLAYRLFSRRLCLL